MFCVGLEFYRILVTAPLVFGSLGKSNDKCVSVVLRTSEQKIGNKACLVLV